MQIKKFQLEPDMAQRTSSKLGKDYVEAIYCHSAKLTYMQSTSCEIWGWMNHKLELRLLGEISKTLAKSEEELKSFLKVKEKSEKSGLKFNIQKTKIMASSPIIS